MSKFNLSWGYKYLYSLYFSYTTMFTGGYGDITPKNVTEILTIFLVQMVGNDFSYSGIINIGYVINEVGRFLFKIN